MNMNENSEMRVNIRNALEIVIKAPPYVVLVIGLAGVAGFVRVALIALAKDAGNPARLNS